MRSVKVHLLTIVAMPSTYVVAVKMEQGIKQDISQTKSRFSSLHNQSFHSTMDTKIEALIKGAREVSRKISKNNTEETKIDQEPRPCKESTMAKSSEKDSFLFSSDLLEDMAVEIAKEISRSKAGRTTPSVKEVTQVKPIPAVKGVIQNQVGQTPIVNGADLNSQKANPIQSVKKASIQNFDAGQMNPIVKKGICRCFITERGCNKGERCSYSHSPKDFLCPDFQNRSCKEGGNCKFRHTKRSKNVCELFLSKSGNCPLGAYCHDSHPTKPKQHRNFKGSLRAANQ